MPDTQAISRRGWLLRRGGSVHEGIMAEFAPHGKAARQQKNAPAVGETVGMP